MKRILRIPIVIIVTLLIVISPVGSQSSDDYNYYDKDDLKLTITTDDGETYHLIARHNDVLLFPQEYGTPLLSIETPQFEFGGFENLILSPSGWLFIDGKEIDYIAKIDLNQNPPLIGPAIPLPELYERPCSYVQRWWGNCGFYRAGGVYLSTFDKVYVSGHRAMLFGMPRFVHYEVTGEGAKLLSEQ